ncbi:PqqD family protein [Phytoactinopolyspora halotolerans]|uniref:PqqD family protein n=1 Tax=Phytoactinopolyspora halotolerans TaxID=1981512 RepID=A0A6L9S4N1_9ACTN|nr:PqqD family protein [Phytoactinopolyspora halotolerans]NED99593.1 PqqD family protein [Phytoactinopolyspora halotolerans]
MKLRTESVSWREIDGEMVILDLESSTYMKTNESGSTLIRMLVEERSMDELVQSLVDAYDVPAEEASEDAGAFVAMLRERNLLETTA